MDKGPSHVGNASSFGTEMTSVLRPGPPDSTGDSFGGGGGGGPSGDSRERGQKEATFL